MSPWDPRGLVNAEGQVYESGDWILQRVVRLGRGAVGTELAWAAAWLARHQALESSKASAQGSRGPLGPNPSGWGPKQKAEWRRQNPNKIYGPWDDRATQGWVQWGGAEAPPGFSTGGGGGGGGWADSAFNNFGGGGSWEGSSNFDTLVSTTGKVTDAVTESGGQVVGAIRDLTREVQRGNSSTGLRAGGVL